jgi:GDSL-like Lipase/Acylhydrolase family
MIVVRPGTIAGPMRVLKVPAAVLAAVVLSLAVAPAATARGTRGTFVAADDPQIAYTEYAALSLTHRRARFYRPDVFNPAGRSSPGTRVNFSSDARAIWMRVDYYHGQCGSTGCGRFWLEVDGVVQQGGVGSDTDEGQHRYLIYTQATRQHHDFSLIYPWGPPVDFLGLVLAGGTPGLLSPPPTRPAFLSVMHGDSITQGQASTGIVKTYPDRVARRNGWSVINMGFGGRSVEGDDGSAIGNLGGDLVTVAIGINNYNSSRTLEETRTRYELLLDNLRALQPTVPVYCITPIWGTREATPNAQGLIPEDYRDVIRSVVQERMLTDPDLHLIEGLDLVPHDPSFYVDGLHPNDEGFFEYARNLAPLLAQ